MNYIRMSDVTLKQESAEILSFREKVELVRLLDRLHTDVIELGKIEQPKADSLFVKTVSEVVSDSVLCVETDGSREQIDIALAALKDAPKARIQIAVPVSLVQMEYLSHARPEAVKKNAAEAVKYAASLCDDVEFLAVDATRSEPGFLYEIIDACAQAGAGTVTVCDTASSMLPDEFGRFISDIREHTHLDEKTVLGFSCSDEMTMADANTVAGIIASGSEAKVSIVPESCASLQNVSTIIRKKGDALGLSMGIRTVELRRICEAAARMFTVTRSSTSPFETGVREERSDRYFTINDDIQSIIRETRNLGYDLSEEDQVRVFEEFLRIADKKEQVTSAEIDVIVASYAMQVPPAYQVDNYIVTSNSVLASTAHIRLRKDEEVLESVAIGDGPVDAAFLAVEQILGRHYELDDFQIQAVTEGREAMGEAIVKLRCMGKIYSGRGLSTDIIGSAISAYVNALNKIVYEEDGE